MAHGGDIYLYACLFLLYGIYAAATEGVSKAWISSLVAKENIAAATGTLSGFKVLHRWSQVRLQVFSGFMPVLLLLSYLRHW